MTDSVMADWANRYLAIRSIVHLPRSNDPRSMEAARAFECADDDGQGREMHSALYAAQSDLGKQSWASIADEATVEDTTAFKRFMEGHPDRRIQAGLALAARFKVTQLPAAIVNGWVIVPATPEHLQEAVSRIIDREIR